MDDEYSVSVIITTYNRREYVLRAIDSVLAQSHPADEIFLVDDGSIDGTTEEVRRRFPGIQYFWQKNKGVSAARNLGIRNASREWIGFLDCDDAWRVDKLEKQLHVLRENPTYRLCYTDEIWIRRGKRVNPKRIHQKFGGDIFEKCLPLCIVSPSSVLIHHHVFQQFGHFDPDLPVCEDYDLWLRVCAFLPVLFVEEPLIIKYGGHEDQLSHKYWGMDRFRIQALEKLIGDSRVDNEKRIAAIQMLLKKINIYMMGARKRRKSGDIFLYEKKHRKYESLLHSIQL